MTDPIADMLTRIRNASAVNHEQVDVPSPKMKVELARIFKEEGYIRDYKVIQDGNKATLRIYLKQGPGQTRVISGIRRISKPGLRVYAKKDEIPKVLGGLGVAVLSTSKGVMSDRRRGKRASAARSFATFGKPNDGVKPNV